LKTFSSDDEPLIHDLHEVMENHTNSLISGDGTQYAESHALMKYLEIVRI
jgi:hypothetical protein